jgi:hypothetical protein
VLLGSWLSYLQHSESDVAESSIFFKEVEISGLYVKSFTFKMQQLGQTLKDHHAVM